MTNVWMMFSPRLYGWGENPVEKIIRLRRESWPKTKSSRIENHGLEQKEPLPVNHSKPIKVMV